MKTIKEANDQIADNQNYMAVYDELLAHLEKAIEGELDIPVDNDSEVVGIFYVEAVRDHLSMIRAEHKEKIRQIEGMEVSDGKSTNSSSGGSPLRIGRPARKGAR